MENAIEEEIKKEHEVPQEDGGFMELVRESVQHDAQLLFAQALSGGTVGVYLEDGMPLYFISDELLKALGYTREQFEKEFATGFLTAIHTEDREGCCAAAQSVMQNAGVYEKICRMRCADGSYTWRRNFGKRIKALDGRDAILLLSIDVSSIVDYQNKLELRAAMYEAKSRELEVMASNIPGGVCEVIPDEHYTLLYGNEGFYNLYGYTTEELLREHNNHMQDVIYEKDRAKVRRIVDEAYNEKKRGFQFEHRIIRRDGSIAWSLVRGNFSEYNGNYILNCVLIDITSRKKTEDEARINERRFRIALEKTDSSIFEYEIKTHVMLHGDKSAEYYGLSSYTENVPDSLVAGGMVHQDNIEEFLDMYHRIEEGDETATCVVKVRLVSGEYSWRKITMTTIFDENGEPVQAIGVLEDIDEQVKREEELRYQSERDTLTDVLNRGTMVRRIGQKLECIDECIGALFVIDIDAFKLVNDRHGHLYGDYVLAETARRLSKVLNSQAQIGRIGGDEFMIFIPNLPSSSIAKKYAEEILSIFQEPYEDRGIVIQVRGSVGGAICPRDGHNFEELYQNADVALYKAKNEGKNKVVFYVPDMRIEGIWVPYSNKEID